MDFSVKQTLIEKKVKVHGQSPTPEKKIQKQIPWIKIKQGKQRKRKGRKRRLEKEDREMGASYHHVSRRRKVSMNHDQEFYTCFWITDLRSRFLTNLPSPPHTIPTFLLVPLISLINI